jgi:hypothetical protein
MRYIHIICIGLIFLLIGASAKAEESISDGNELLQNCSEVLKEDHNTNFASMGLCLGYLHGMRDMQRLNTIIPDLPPLCFPKGVTLEQTRRVVVKYLQGRPEELHQLGSMLTYLALVRAFPCPPQP